MADRKRCSIRMKEKIQTASVLQGIFATIRFMERTGSFFISGAPQTCLVFLQSSTHFPHISLIIFSSYMTREWFLLMHTFIWRHLVERRRATRHWRVGFNVWLKRALEWQETLSVLIGKKNKKTLWLLMRKTPWDLTVPIVHRPSVHEAPHYYFSAVVLPTLCSPLWEVDTSKVPERIYPPGLIQTIKRRAHYRSGEINESMYYSAPFDMHLMELNTSPSDQMLIRRNLISCSLKRLGFGFAWKYKSIFNTQTLVLFSLNGYPLSSRRSEVHGIQLGWNVYVKKIKLSAFIHPNTPPPLCFFFFWKSQYKIFPLCVRQGV